MPYKLEEDNGGYYVVNEQTGKRKNKTPIPKARALAYMRALYAAENGSMKEIKEQVLDAFTEKMEFVSDDQRKAVFASIASGGESSNSDNLPNWAKPDKKRIDTAYNSHKDSSTSEIREYFAGEKRTLNWNIDKLEQYPHVPDRFRANIKNIYTRMEAMNRILKERGEDQIDIPKLPSKITGKEAKPALMVYKDAAGQDRWVLFSSNAYQDRDREIVSTAALEADVARADKEQNYGPLRWWHVGKPDPIKRSPGPGMDLGTCDFNAMHGRVLIESGTFNNPKVAAAVKEIAPLLQVSIGYFHPRTEPDSAGVFHNIQRFERSILPAGRASNPFTAVSVIQKSDNGGSEMISEKIKAFAALLKDDELVQSILAQAEQKEKEAQDLQTAFKGEEPPAEAITETEKDAPEVEAVAVVENEPEIEEEHEPVIGDMTPDAFAGLLAEAMDKAMEPHRKELAELQASMKTKDDSEAALREALQLQAQTISTIKSQLDELTGSQPRAATKGYRDSQSETTVVKDDSRVKGKQPTVDPDFIKMFTPGQ